MVTSAVGLLSLALPSTRPQQEPCGTTWRPWKVPRADAPRREPGGHRGAGEGWLKLQRLDCCL